MTPQTGTPQTGTRSRTVRASVRPARQITVTQGGRMVAFATVTQNERHELFASVHIEPGHVPMQTREALVDALMTVAGSDGARHLNLVMPLGDCLLEDLYRRCEVTSLRPTGATCLVNAELAGAPSPALAPRQHGAPTPDRQVDVAVRSLV